MPDDDITANRHGGNPESRSAKEISRHRAGLDRRRIIAPAKASRPSRNYLVARPRRCCNSPHQICFARFSERVFIKTGTRRTRRNSPAGVMVLAQ